MFEIAKQAIQIGSEAEADLAFEIARDGSEVIAFAGSQ